jgi:hypothetical protein
VETVDDVSGKQKSVIEITDNGGELQGKVLQVMNLSPEEISQGRRTSEMRAVRRQTQGSASRRHDHHVWRQER